MRGIPYGAGRLWLESSDDRTGAGNPDQFRAYAEKMSKREPDIVWAFFLHDEPRSLFVDGVEFARIHQQ